jgi:tetratricopeptide (TPR) repeat protein
LLDLYPDSAEPLLAVAVIARNTGDLDGAEAYLRAAVQAEPDNLDALRQLALLLDQRQSYDDLVDVYGQMLALTPDDADLYVARAMIHARLGDSDAALDDLRSAQQIDPSRTYAFLNAAAAASGQRDYESATGIASAGLDSDPESISLRLMRGLDWLALGDLDAALEDFDAVLELDDLNVGGYLWRGRTLMRLERYEDALPDLQRAAELGVQSGVSNVNLGYEAMADAAEALAYSDPQAAFAYLAGQVFDYGSRDAIMLGYARVDWVRGSPDLALGRLNNLVDRDYVPALYWRAVVLAEQGEQAAAVDDLTAYLEVRRSGPEAEWAYDLLSTLEDDQ